MGLETEVLIEMVIDVTTGTRGRGKDDFRIDWDPGLQSCLFACFVSPEEESALTVQSSHRERFLFACLFDSLGVLASYLALVNFMRQLLQSVGSATHL